METKVYKMSHELCKICRFKTSCKNKIDNFNKYFCYEFEEEVNNHD